MHNLKCLLKLVSVDIPIVVRHHQQTRATDVRNVKEDLRVCICLENRSAKSFITLENLEERVSCNLGSFVVDLAAIVDVEAWGSLGSWLVK